MFPLSSCKSLVLTLVNQETGSTPNRSDFNPNTLSTLSRLPSWARRAYAPNILSKFVLDASETWNFDASADCWATEPMQTLKTFKTPRNHVKAEATEHHPAQVDVYYEDITIGYWRTVKFSGAMLARRINELLQRVEILQQAVMFAREEANNSEVEDKRVGERIFQFIFR